MTRIERNLAAHAVGILIGVIATSAFATFEPIAPVVVKPAITAVPAVAPAVAPATAPAAASTAPAAPAPVAAGPQADSWLVKGGAAFVGVAVFFYAVICTSERHRNPGSWFAEHCRPRDWFPR